ncbi:universal stress protein [Solirubrobacter soli]|uniref:universal stress protein n=1 Tax=Solirubrobacter soli TaxID=363832 RepID=UPI00055E3D81|nr:universal stress protein [Solirubrobacter soli]
MTRLLLAYDGSEAAKSALAAAAALFGEAEGVIATVQPPLPSLEAGAMARIALPDAVIREGLENLRDDNERAGRERLAEAAEHGAAHWTTRLVHAVTPWRGLRALARELDADVIVCGTRGEGPVDRVLLGSTAASLLHHAERPLLVVPAGASAFDGPMLAAYDESEGAQGALRFAAAHLAGRRVVVATAWRSPVQHSLRGQALVHSRVGMFEEYASAIDSIWSDVAGEAADAGADFARELGLDADTMTPESGRGAAHALLDAARELGAAVVLAGSRGRGAAASTILGSVATGLVTAAARPVLVVPDDHKSSETKA